MAVTPAQQKQIRQFVIANYAPKLRKSALKKFTVSAGKAGNVDFIKAAAARKKAPGAPAPKTPAGPPPGPYDRYKPLGPGPVGTLETMDKMSGNQQQWGLKVGDWLKNVLGPMTQAGADASKYYAGLGAQAAGMGALPNMMPLTSYNGQTVQPGTSGAAIQAATEQGKGVAAAGQQSSSYQGWMQEMAGRDLSAGINASYAASLAQIPANWNQAKLEYMQTLDQNLFEMEKANADREAEMALEEAKMANDRYTARLGLVSDLAGTNAKLQLGELDANTALTKSREANATKRDIAASTIMSREKIAAANNAIQALKAKATKAKGTASAKKANTDLLHKVQTEFDKLWTGEAPDPMVPGSGYGWRYAARAKDGPTREKAANQVLSWLAATGLPPAQVHRLFRSKGFSDAEFQRAVRRVESGGGY